MDAIKELMGLGILVEPDAAEMLKKLDDSQIKSVLVKSTEHRPLVLTTQLISHFLKKTAFKILSAVKKNHSVSIQTFTDLLNRRYDFVQSILARKVELSNIVSINKCSNGNLSVIGMVKNKEQSNGNMAIELEDRTGTLKAIVSKDIGEKIGLDDIIAVYGSYNNKLLFGEKVIYPDVPLRNVTFANTDAKIAFIINHDFSNRIETEAEYIFIGNCDNAEKAKEHYPRANIFIVSDCERADGNLNYITNPASIDIDGVVVLIMFDNDPLKAIKKRFLAVGNSDFLIENIPDIVLTNKDINTNYKSISIVNDRCEIDLKSRNLKKL